MCSLELKPKLWCTCLREHEYAWLDAPAHIFFAPDDPDRHPPPPGGGAYKEACPQGYVRNGSSCPIRSPHGRPSQRFGPIHQLHRPRTSPPPRSHCPSCPWRPSRCHTDTTDTATASCVGLALTCWARTRGGRVPLCGYPDAAVRPYMTWRLARHVPKINLVFRKCVAVWYGS